MLTVTRKILISAPKESVSEYLRDLSRLPEYEQKIDACTVRYPDSETAFAEVSGRYLGLPWRGAFRMSYTRDGGYRIEMVRGPFKEVGGGFHLRAVTGGTLLTHDEQYHVPVAFKPLSGLLARWLARTMEVELAVVKEGAEKLHRRRLLADIDNVELSALA